MIGLDTNVLARYLLHDEPQQAARVSVLMQELSAEAPGWISSVVMVELVWVLETACGKTRSEIALALQALLQARELVVEQADRHWLALRMYRAGKTTYARCLIAQTALAAGCEAIYTLDAAAAADAGMHEVP